MTTIQEALLTAANQFKKSDNLFESARIDAEVLLAHVLDKTRTSLYTHALTNLTDEQLAQYQQCVDKRLAGLPVAYITGLREFWSLTLEINNSVLIPRPDTELLVELALTSAENQLFEDVGPGPNLPDPYRLGLGPTKQILDLGTGSGAIALAIASEKPDWHITAIDICSKALSVARHNANRLQLNNITFLESNWFEALPEQQTFDMIIANPPYIASDDLHLAQGDVRFEPQKALIAAQNGLGCLFHIIQYSLARLAPNGLLLVEHGNEQHEPIKAFFESCGFHNIRQHRDLQNHIRVTSGIYLYCQT